MTYQQLSEEDRHMIAAMKTWGWSLGAIAKELGRHRSTVYREVKRNCVKKRGWYGAALAGEKTRGRRRRSRRNLHYGAAHFVPIEAMLRKDFSPEQIVGRLALEGVKSMSHETIYLWVWADKKRGGTLWRHLRGARKQKRKRYGRYDSRGRLAGKKMIGDRPAEVAERKRFGDWEIDTVHGTGKPCVVTVVERKSGLLRLGKLATASSKDTLERTTEILAAEPHPVRTITADNGTEFHMYKELEARLGTKVYFATPHHAWERGTNENTNGLLRQYLPRGTPLHALQQKQCLLIADKLNARPRLRLGFHTPHEVYHGINNPARDWAASCGKLFAPVLGSGPIADPIPLTTDVALQI